MTFSRPKDFKKHYYNVYNYSYIIAGAGLAGLSMAMHLLQSDLKYLKVLVIDKEIKNKNDRTWCFWTKEKNNWYDEIIFKKWQKFSFSGEGFDKAFDISPYTYCMIRGIDFYEYCLNKIKADDRFDIVTDEIIEISDGPDLAILKTEDVLYAAPFLFNSAYFRVDTKKNHVNYHQHFKGLLIETDKNVFDKDCPVFMDFDIPQENDCRFVYVIPHSEKRALIEYTGFSRSALDDSEYDDRIKHYIENKLSIKNYTVLETEKGIIPMYESAFVNPFGKNVINIGTSGGASKPSTGFTFYFVQKDIANIMQQLKAGLTILKQPVREKKFLLYDKILLDVLNRKKVGAAKIFTDLFKHNKTSDLLDFLNEASDFKQELKIMNSVPKWQFTVSAFRKMFYR